MNKKVLLISGAAITLSLLSYLLGAKLNKPVPKLEDGKELVVTIDGKKLTADEFYTELKEKSGVSTLVTTIDEFIVNKEIEATDEIKAKADGQVESTKYYAEQSGAEWIAYLNSYGFKDEAAVYDYFLMEAKKEEVARNYIKDQITDTEINTYYEKNIFGDITAKHILITPETTSSMTDAEVTAEEAKALVIAKEVITKLEAGEKWNDLVKEYSDDAGTKENNGELTFGKTTVVAEFWNAAAALTNDKYTKTPVKSQYGYHIIYRVSQKDKPELKDVKEEVLNSITDEKTTADADLIQKSWVEVRKLYNIVTNDPQVKELYDNVIDNLK